MIYVSSCCVKSNSIKDSVSILAENGISNIELTGGTKYYDNYVEDLLRLRDKHSLNYTVHNYFPPPPQHFMLNLASLDDELYKQSIEHCKLAISLCKQLGSNKYGVHAGFLIDFSTDEAGKKISYRVLNDRNKSLVRFSEAWDILVEEAGMDVKLYVENNVFSKTNAKTYDGENPFLLTDYESYLELDDNMDFNLLLDLAHLKVSVTSLGLSFKNEVNRLIPLTDYIHISGNDGLHDQNLGLEGDEELKSILCNSDLTGKIITLEVYDGMSSILQSIETIQSIRN
jgi:sugar phosphate isomerase/epimerase